MHARLFGAEVRISLAESLSEETRMPAALMWIKKQRSRECCFFICLLLHIAGKHFCKRTKFFRGFL